MPRDSEPSAAPRLITLASIAVIVAALYLGREVLIPFALAVLLTFLLAPLSRRIERTGLPRIPAVIVVALLASSTLAGVGYLLTQQAVALTANLPQYQRNITNKIQALRSGANGRLKSVTHTIEGIRADLASEPPTTGEPGPNAPEPSRMTAPGGSGPDSRPIPVHVVEPSSRILGIITDTLGVLAPPLVTLGISVVFVIFMLIQRDDMRDRLISLMGQGRINLTTEALDDIGGRISRYLLMQLIVNVSYGIPVGIGLYLIGVPNAALWGLLGTLLRYLPYIGPWISASLPILLSLAVFDDWWHVGAVVAMFIVLELILNNFLEPWLYGATTGLSTVAVLVSAVFWGWLWGPVGLLLSTPMTACVVVLGRHVPQLAFLNTLLGDEPVLPAQTRFYQRLLAMDQEDASDLLEDHLEDAAPEEVEPGVYDDLLIPALHLAEQDRHRGRLSDEREQYVFRSLRAMLDELRDWRQDLERRRPEGGNDKPLAASERTMLAGVSVLCVPVRDVADEIAAEMLAHFLEARGMRARHLSATYLTGEVLKQVEQSEAGVVCLSAVPPGAITYTRYLCKRLRNRWPELPIVVGLWDTGGDLSRVRERMGRAGAEKLVTTFGEAYDTLHTLAQHPALSSAGHAPASVTPRAGQADAA